MVIYIIIAFALLVVMILQIFNKIDKFIPCPFEKEGNKKKFKMTVIVITAILALAFILFAIAELVDVLYKPFNIIAIIFIVFTVAFYFYQNYTLKKYEREFTNDNN